MITLLFVDAAKAAGKLVNTELYLMHCLQRVHHIITAQTECFDSSKRITPHMLTCRCTILLMLARLHETTHGATCRATQ